MTTIGESLHAATSRLAATSPSARLDAEVLLAHVLGRDRAYVLAERQHSLTPDESTAFQTLIQRRMELESVAYITGHKEFYGLDFVVDQRVLVPRPETELLVELAVKWSATHGALNRTPLTIADIGTGSGCVAVSLAHLLPEAHIFAVDLSADALAVARLNAQRHNVTDRITLLHGAGCTPLPQPVRLIVSNPPYTVLAEVDPNVHRWEPHLALDGGADQGFAIPAQLLREMPPYLEAGGAVLMEIGAWQGTMALEVARSVFPHAQCAIHQDLAGLDRVLSIETKRPTGS